MVHLALLAALIYNGMATRRRQLAEQSPAYLEWIWHQPSEGEPGFVGWLCNEAPVFWITGKPGSGKSTLMKYLAEHESGSEILQRHHRCSWSIVHFYFDYRSGKRVPNSLEGMLRSILYQLVGANSTANQAVRQELNARHGHALYENLDMSDLQKAFRIACKAISRTHKICAFVDGLDEFSGHHIEVVRMVDFLVNNGVHKLCVASRPEYVLVQQLGRHPSFKMQDRNLLTIRAYVNQAFEKMPPHPPYLDVSELIAKIVSKAEGVILWAYLVTGYMVELLLAGGTREEVYKRLDEFPQELNEVYERLLNNVKPEWQVQAAVMLLLIQTGLDTTTPWDLSCAMAYLRDCGKLPSWPKDILTPHHFLLRLRASTGSMVDIVQGPTLLPGSNWQEAPSGDEFRDRYHCQSTRVRLFHKTLENYLTASNWLNQALTRADPTFHPENLWLRLCSKCITENEISEHEYKQVVDLLPQPDLHRRKLSETRGPPLPSNETAIRLAEAFSGSVPTDWSLAFLACAVANLPAHIELVSPRENALNIDCVKDALASRMMQLHPVRVRLRTFEAPVPGCRCYLRYAEWDPTYAGHDFQPAQRASLVAMTHEWPELLSLDAICDPRAADSTEAVFCRRCIDWILFPRLDLPTINGPIRQYVTDADEKHLLLALTRLAKCVDETSLTSVVMQPTRFGNKALAVVCPRLRMLEATRTLRIPLEFHPRWTPGGMRHLNSVTSYGFNLLLPWVWHVPEKDFLNAGELRDETLRVLLNSGLDINSPCSKFGPPAHTLAETVVAYEAIYNEQFVDILRCLARHGADMNVMGPHGTVLDTARRTLRKQELGQYELFVPFHYIGYEKWYIEATLGIIEMLQQVPDTEGGQ